MLLSKNDLELINYINQQTENIQELTSDLIKIPTENPPGNNYREICNFLETRLKSSGFETKMIRATGSLGDSDANPRWNLIARHEVSRSGECIHFNSHTDVVKAGNGWSMDPFGGIIKNGRVYDGNSLDQIYPEKKKQSVKEWYQEEPNNLPGIN